MKDWLIAFVAAACFSAFVIYCSYIVIWAFP
jgi:hypothetical protein